MDKKYYFLAANTGFYIYPVSSSIPDEAKEITEEVYNALFAGQETGKVITADKDGYPVLADPPPLTQEQEVTVADAKKSRLMADATVAINPLQDAVDLDMATDAEKALLTAWKKYRVLLNRIDTSKAPGITWPDQPA